MTDLIPPTTSRVADRTDADINAAFAAKQKPMLPISQRWSTGHQ